MARRGENIRKRKDGRWEGRYTCRSGGGSESKVRSVYARTYRDVRGKLLAAKREEAERSRLAHPYINRAAGPETCGADALLTDAAGEWLEGVKETKKYSTYVKYRTIYDRYLSEALKGKKVWEVTGEVMRGEILPAAAANSGSEILSESIEKSIYCVMNRILAHVSGRYRVMTETLVRERGGRETQKKT